MTKSIFNMSLILKEYNSTMSFLQELIWPSVSPIAGSFKFYKLRELWWIDSYKDEYNMDALFCFLKLCPALEQLFVTVGLCHQLTISKI